MMPIANCHLVFVHVTPVNQFSSINAKPKQQVHVHVHVYTIHCTSNVLVVERVLCIHVGGTCISRCTYMYIIAHQKEYKLNIHVCTIRRL